MNAPVTAEMLRPELWSDPWWRINNLYKIVTEDNEIIRFIANEEQKNLYENLHGRNLILKARQLGFTTFLCILALDQCLFNKNFAAGIIAHNRPQAEKFFRNKVMFAYDNLPEALKETVGIKKRTESEVNFSNGSVLYVDTSFRGGTLQFLHVSEFGKICIKYPHKAKEIVTGAFEAVSSDNLIFIESTAEGQGGYFYEYSREAQRLLQEKSKLGKLDWKLHFYPWFAKKAYALDETVIATDKQKKYFADLRKKGILLTPQQEAWWVKKKQVLLNEMGREYPSTPDEAFEQAIDGAIYAEQMARIRELGRIGSVPFTLGTPVNTFWDLGSNDKTAIWLHQQVGLEHRFIKYTEASFKGLAYWWKWLTDWANEHTAIFGAHYLPHDANSDLQTVEIESKKSILTGLGMKNIKVVPRIPEISTGIDLSRTALINNCWFDKEGCEQGIRCLDSYQFEWDEKRGVWSNKPLHNWASDGSDAWRQFAQGYEQDTGQSQQINSFASRQRDGWR